MATPSCRAFAAATTNSALTSTCGPDCRRSSPNSPSRSDLGCQPRLSLSLSADATARLRVTSLIRGLPPRTA
jgi:hypothetical protein